MVEAVFTCRTSSALCAFRAGGGSCWVTSGRTQQVHQSNSTWKRRSRLWKDAGEVPACLAAEATVQHAHYSSSPWEAWGKFRMVPTPLFSRVLIETHLTGSPQGWPSSGFNLLAQGWWHPRVLPAPSQFWGVFLGGCWAVPGCVHCLYCEVCPVLGRFWPLAHYICERAIYPL